MLERAAVAGMGIAMLPTFVVGDALADGTLRAILPRHRPEPFGLYAMRLSRKFTPARVRLFIEFLKEKLETDD